MSGRALGYEPGAPRASVALLPIPRCDVATLVSEWRPGALDDSSSMPAIGAPPGASPGGAHAHITDRDEDARAQAVGSIWPDANPPVDADGGVNSAVAARARPFPHPLLRRGLVVLDTPGLNALGAEPELTLACCPTATRSSSCSVPTPG